MTGTTVLQFSTLTDLASFIKTVHPQAYVINTLQLTVMALLSEFEIAVALEQFNGVVATQKTEEARAKKVVG